MPDRDPAPDPIDEAYVRAEAMMSDDEARAARRARVLAAVARELVAPPATSSPSTRRATGNPGRWLAAAGIAGLSVFLATQLYQPTPRRPPAAPAPSTAPSRTAPAILAAPTSPAPPPAPPSPALTTTRRAARSIPAPPAPIAVPLNVPAPPPLNIAPVERPRVATAVVAADARRMAPLTAKPTPVPLEASPAAPSPSVSGLSARLPSDDAARLRAAAAAGSTADLEALLVQGVPVDAPDADGETALMKSIQADHPVAAALLRRHGASLDLKNHAGESARDMAMAKGDTELNQAIGLSP